MAGKINAQIKHGRDMKITVEVDKEQIEHAGQIAQAMLESIPEWIMSDGDTLKVIEHSGFTTKYVYNKGYDRLDIIEVIRPDSGREL